MLADRPTRWIYLPLLLSAGAVLFLAILTYRGLAEHRRSIAAKLRAGLNQRVEQAVERLRLREEQRPPQAFATAGTAVLDPLVLACAEVDAEAVTAPYGEEIPERTRTALAWCEAYARELLELLKSLEAADLATVDTGEGTWKVSAYRLALGPDATPLLWRAVRRGTEPAAPYRLQVIVLDAAALVDLATAAAVRLSPAAEARWLRHPDRPLAFAFYLPEEVIEANAFTGGHFQALILAVVLCLLSIVAGLVVLRHQRRRLIREQDFTSAVSHELKTPVAAMQALAGNLIAGRVHSPERQAEYHRIIAREADRLGRLVDNVLWQARVEQGRLRIAPSPNQLNRACREVAEQLGDELEIELDLDDLADVVAVDHEAVRRILVNLIDNARKYAPGSPIRIETRQEGGHARLRVADRGPGIAAEDRVKVLRSWQRADDHAHQPGLGLGLALVTSLIDAHGGQIRLLDNRPRGLVVEVHLPLLLDRYLVP